MSTASTVLSSLIHQGLCHLQALMMTQSPHENPEVLIQIEAMAGLT